MRGDWRFLCLCLLGFAWTLASCGDDEGKKSDTPAKAEKQAFTGTLSGDGAPGAVSNEQKDAAPNVFAAGIAGPVLGIWLVPDASAAYAISVTINTDDSHKLPGTFNVGAPPADPVFVMVIQGAMVYESNGTGTVTINECPKSMGDKVSGKFTGVGLVAVEGGGTLTLDGTFEVGVAAIAGYELVCFGGTTPITPGQCDYDPDGACTGPCCAMAQCVSMCFMNDCLVPCMGMDFNACIACGSNCETVVCAEHFTTECRTKWEALNTCEAQHGCDDLDDDEAEEACVADNCCAEVKAAFQP